VTLAIAALGLYASVFGSFGPPGACTRTAPTASAAPSPTCGGDLRECLRLSAKTGIYGARYVTAEDVARCVEAFNACIHGGASAGGGNANPTTTTSGGGATKVVLPEHFGIDTADYRYDCTVTGTAVNCTSARKSPYEGIDSWRGTVTGTLSGLTMTGTVSIEQTGHARSRSELTVHGYLVRAGHLIPLAPTGPCECARDPRNGTRASAVVAQDREAPLSRPRNGRPTGRQSARRPRGRRCGKWSAGRVTSPACASNSTRLAGTTAANAFCSGSSSPTTW
jgi:hypothetical protein